MKKLMTASVFVAFCLCDAWSQLKVDHRGHVSMAYDVVAENPTFYIGPKDLEYDMDDGRGEWGVELLNGSLNFWRPFGNTNWGNYFFYIAQDGVGVGKTPSYKLDVNGDIATYGTLRIASDERLKTNVQPVSMELKSGIYDLEAKAYTKQNLVVDDADLNRFKGVPESALQTKYKMDKEVFEYGFIAQELKEVFPELVTQDKEGYYSINYIGLIPLMVEALKEQNEQNEAQQAEIDSLKRAVLTLTKESNLPHIRSAASPGDGSTALQTPVVTGCRLEQNTPNPFNRSTQIKYYLPETIISAYLCIYDMQGKQLQQIALTQRGEGAELISASQLDPGIYLYALIADGQEVDVKRMILTE